MFGSLHSVSKCSFLVCLLQQHVVFNATPGTFLKALDVWAMGVTLYCFIFGKASLHLFCLLVTCHVKGNSKSWGLCIRVICMLTTLCSILARIQSSPFFVIYTAPSSGIIYVKESLKLIWLLLFSLVVFWDACFLRLRSKCNVPSFCFSLSLLCSMCSAHLLTSTYWLCTIR